MPDDYNVHDQQENSARATEDRDYQALIDSFTSRLRGLGAVPNIDANWYSQGGKDLHQTMTFGSSENRMRAPGTIGAIATAFGGRKEWRKKQADAARKQAMIQSLQEEMARALESKRSDIDAGRGTRQRMVLTEQVKSMFDDPTRAATQKQQYDATLANSLAQITDAYKGAYTKSVQGVADRGMLGSSVDAQQRADLGATRDAGAASAADAAGSQLQARRASDQQTRQQLMSLINSSDPAQAAAARQRLAELSSRTNDAGIQGQANQLGWNVGDWATQMQSQALGGVGYAAAGGVRQGANRYISNMNSGSGG